MSSLPQSQAVCNGQVIAERKSGGPTSEFNWTKIMPIVGLPFMLLALYFREKRRAQILIRAEQSQLSASPPVIQVQAVVVSQGNGDAR